MHKHGGHGDAFVNACASHSWDQLCQKGRITIIARRNFGLDLQKGAGIKHTVTALGYVAIRSPYNIMFPKLSVQSADKSLHAIHYVFLYCPSHSFTFAPSQFSFIHMYVRMYI